jgi:hypothetical protein
MYNGPRIHDKQVMEASLAEEASQLLEPFIIHYGAGQVVGLSVRAGDEEWAINIKQGLASLLQIAVSHLQSPAFISVKVHYSCRHRAKF